MMAFNHPQHASSRGRERESIRAELHARLESVLFTLFPEGKKRHGRFLIGNVHGAAGASLDVMLAGPKAGLWTDRATGEGGDIFDLIAAHRGLEVQRDFAAVLEVARHLLGLPQTPVSSFQRQPAQVADLGTPTAKWDYLDAEGHLIACVVRYDPPGRRSCETACHPVPAVGPGKGARR